MENSNSLNLTVPDEEALVKVINEWALSVEGKEAIKEAFQEVVQESKSEDSANRVDTDILRKRITV